MWICRLFLLFGPQIVRPAPCPFAKEKNPQGLLTNFDLCKIVVARKRMMMLEVCGRYVAQTFLEECDVGNRKEEKLME